MTKLKIGDIVNCMDGWYWIVGRISRHAEPVYTLLPLKGNDLSNFDMSRPQRKAMGRGLTKA